jgi:hypothetical protein
VRQSDPLPAGIRTASYSRYCYGSQGVPSQIAATLAEYPEPLLAASGLRELGVCARIVDGRGKEPRGSQVGRRRFVGDLAGSDAFLRQHAACVEAELAEAP